MLKVGVTGGIGSGKTTVCKVFEVLNIPVYYSDQKAKELMVSNTALKEQLITTFGNNTFDTNGILNSAYLSSIVFNDEQKLKKLNSLVHPFVLEDFSSWCIENSKEKYVILESAIIFESGIESMLDHVVIVDAPLEIRFKRITDRDNVSLEEVEHRMSTQLTAEIKNNLSKMIIFNDGKKSLIDQILSLHKVFSDQ
jgi:dephospho-CoA kinase